MPSPRDKNTPRFSPRGIFERACKPGSVRAESAWLPSVCGARYRASEATCGYAGPAPRLPPGSPANREQRFVGNGRRDSAYGVAPDRVYICTQSPAVPVSFYLAFPSVPSGGRAAVLGRLFLLHFPGSRLRRTLSVILSCGARTFLTSAPFGVRRAAAPPARVNYTSSSAPCQYFRRIPAAATDYSHQICCLFSK